MQKTGVLRIKMLQKTNDATKNSKDQDENRPDTFQLNAENVEESMALLVFLQLQSAAYVG